jgi:hypothetical protein
MKGLFRHLYFALGRFSRKVPGLHKLTFGMYKKYNEWKYNRLREDQYPQALKKWCYLISGKHISLDNPRTFDEKIQWLKLYDNLPIKTVLSDKYKAREYIANKVGEEYLVPLLGVWQNANDINFDELPDRFVLKTNHGCGYNIIVKDKKELNTKKARQQLNYWLKKNYAFLFVNPFALVYKDIPPLIIAEQYLENDNNDLFDYKFHCYNGEPKHFLYVKDRNKDMKLSIYDLEFNPLPFRFAHYLPVDSYEMPPNFEQMVILAKKLCEGFKFVRIDFYNINGKIYCGEITFIPGSIIYDIQPPEYEYILGDLIDLKRNS